MTTLGQFRRSFSKVYTNLYFRLGENKFNDKTLLSELSNKDNPIVDWNEYATAEEIKYAIEAWLSLNVDFYFEKSPGSRPRYIKIDELDLTTPLAELNKTVVEKGAVDLTYWVEDNGIDSRESIGSSMQGESRDSKGKDSSSQLDVDFSMKNVYYMTFYLYCDADGIELTESENAAEAILDKINTINSLYRIGLTKKFMDLYTMSF